MHIRTIFCHETIRILSIKELINNISYTFEKNFEEFINNKEIKKFDTLKISDI